MYLGNIIKTVITDQGLSFSERQRTIHTACPTCGKDDKCSILKANGATICYRGSCSFGRQWFYNWLSLTARISIQEARDIIYGKPLDAPSGGKLTIDLDPKQSEVQIDEPLVPITWPLDHFISLVAPEASDGVAYLQSRGISVEMAAKYGIMYSILTRRVMIPIFMGGTCFGYQGRSIDDSCMGPRMKNNTGFRRDSLIMFYDRLLDSDHVILCEGPFDAMKFDSVGGNVASMGKVVTSKQLSLLKNLSISKIYLALDDDAIPEMRKLASQFSIPVYRILVPQSCVDRCREDGKKADFGECTFDECKQAFASAVKLDGSYLMLNIK